MEIYDPEPGVLVLRRDHVGEMHDFFWNIFFSLPWHKSDRPDIDLYAENI